MNSIFKLSQLTYMQTSSLPKKQRKQKHVFVVSFLAFCLLSISSVAQPVGANMNNPIVMGNYAGGSFSYSDTKNNSTSNGYLNDYGQASDDIYYRFTVQGSTTITISHCGSGFDTYMHLLDASGGFITNNDDNGPLCSGVTASISTTLAAGTYYIVAEGYYTNAGNITTTVNLTVQAPPPPPVTDTRNFIKVWDATAPEADPNNLMTRPFRDVKHSVTYFDGLGRPEQSIAKQGSLITSTGVKADLVSPVVYDQFGREVQKYLPYVSPSSDGLYKASPLTEQNAFYTGSSSPIAGQGETYFYGQTDFEPSPLNRPAKTYAPGNSWVGASRGVEAKYWVNTANDAVRIWNVTDMTNDFGNYASTAAYDAGQLYKNITMDEAGKQVIEFKDKEGKVILKKVQLTATADDGTGKDHTGWLCTYYVYDDLAQLRAVIQPKAVEQLASTSWQLSTVLLDELCFRYEYDPRGRMIVKKVPGAGAVQIVYDARDRLVMTQDANLRAQQQWLVTVYENNFNRPIYTYKITDPASSTTDPLNAANANNHRNAGYIAVSYPPIANYSSELLSEIHYDFYAGLPSGLSAAFNASGYSTYLNASSSSPEYAETVPASPSQLTKGAVTWTRVKVLGTGNQFNSSVSLYDDKGRLIQVQSINVTGGVDVVTNQYSFSNQVVRNHVKHQEIGSTTQTYEVATRSSYDDLGRTSLIEKSIGATPSYKQIASLSYDALGQLKTKKLSPSFNGNLGLETLTYDYNVRGWVLGANRADLVANGSSASKFSFELGYDKATNSSGRNFSAAQYNGNITGMIWKSAGDGIRRKYDFSYDAVNRLMQGVFEQNNTGASWDNTQINYTVKMGDGINAASAYDANGNILAMTQYGWKLGQASTIAIDNLTYNYRVNGTGDQLRNKLYKVSDAIVDPTSKLGDFKDGSNSNDDYNYDVNGNLVSDNNKSISSISYNYLNLPGTIAVTAKGMITYVYDASGNKLKKTAVDNSVAGKTITTTTTYVAGFTYESKQTVPANSPNGDYTDRLQFFPMEEGRIRPVRDAGNNITSFTYDYFLKDHLGNVRMVLTEESKTDPYPAATLEPASIASESSYYGNLSSTQYPKPSWFSDPVYTGSTQVARLKNTITTKKVGPNILLKVMAGDSYNIRVASGWTGSSPVNSSPEVLTDLLNILSSGIAGVSGGKATQADLQNGTSGLNSGIQSFMNTQTSTGAPKAYINWILFDEQFKYYSGGFEQVGASGVTTIHTRNGLPISKNGYLCVYTSNEATNIDVFFDNLQVTHIRGPILEETHYYPFGLVQSGISSKAASSENSENRKKFNGIEHTTEFDLNIYDAFYRSADPQIGRWWQTDPKPNMAESPYAMMGSNPLSNNDPLGDTAVVRWRSGFLGLGQRREARYVGDQWIDSKTREAVDANDVSKKSAKRLMNDYSGLNNNSAFDPVTDKINTNEANVVLTNSKKAETDPNNAFRSGSSKELTVNLSKSYKGNTGENLGNVPVRLNSQQIMGHELGHVYDILNGKPSAHFEGRVVSGFGYVGITIPPSEINAMYWENILRSQAGLPLRIRYFYTNNPKVSWSGGDAIVIYDPKTAQPTSIANLDGQTYKIK
jgi:RHS repeat-associated protein